jgi:hypothetical protein
LQSFDGGTGVPPVSEIQKAFVSETTVAAMTHCQWVVKTRENGDRRDAGPMCLTASAAKNTEMAQ